ncbi:MAG: AAA family ATPase [Actinobacteria bacterium]|nr:AAA family ATPase [Actinomycetota bacterium]
MYRDLLGQAQNLRTIELLQARAAVVREATFANQVAPAPKRNAVLGGLLGLLLGLGLAFLWNALDRRIRTQGEVERMLGIPLLARLPAPGRALRRGDRLAMLHEPSDVSAEAVRRLRTNFELANLDGDARVIMVTSAGPDEGKSTTIANLAVALARSGRSVALVELDLRRPALAAFFRLGGRPGLTDVALRRIKLEDALVPVQLSPLGAISRNGRNVGTSDEGLHVLPSGLLPADPGEFVGTQAVARLLDELRRDHDFVLVDAPPLLAVVDAMTLSTRVDAVFAVVRLGLVNRPMLEDLGRGLEASPAKKLGFVLTGTDDRKMYGSTSYGYHVKSAETLQAPTPLTHVKSRH